MLIDVIEDSAKQVAASEGPIDASKKDGMFIQYIWKHPSFQYDIWSIITMLYLYLAMRWLLLLR